MLDVPGVGPGTSFGWLADGGLHQLLAPQRERVGGAVLAIGQLDAVAVDRLLLGGHVCGSGGLGGVERAAVHVGGACARPGCCVDGRCRQDESDCDADDADGAGGEGVDAETHNPAPPSLLDFPNDSEYCLVIYYTIKHKNNQ